MRFFKSHGFGKPPLREMLFLLVCLVFRSLSVAPESFFPKKKLWRRLNVPTGGDRRGPSQGLSVAMALPENQNFLQVLHGDRSRLHESTRFRTKQAWVAASAAMPRKSCQSPDTPRAEAACCVGPSVDPTGGRSRCGSAEMGTPLVGFSACCILDMPLGAACGIW